MYPLRKLREPALGKSRAQVWLMQAKYDLAASNLSMGSGYYEWASYQAEQAVEKALKSIILNSGYIAPRTHKIPVLMGIANNLNENFKQTRFEFRFIDTFTMISRYPFLLPGRKSAPHDLIQKDDAQKLHDHAQEFLNKIEIILRDNKPVLDGSTAYESQLENIDIKGRVSDIVNKIKDYFDPEKIILYGSYARNIHTRRYTTIDILVIANTQLNFIERIKTTREITKGGSPAIEPLIYTPEEYKYMIEEEGEGFLESAIAEGIELYSREKGIMLNNL